MCDSSSGNLLRVHPCKASARVADHLLAGWCFNGQLQQTTILDLSQLWDEGVVLCLRTSRSRSSIAVELESLLGYDANRTAAVLCLVNSTNLCSAENRRVDLLRCVVPACVAAVLIAAAELALARGRPHVSSHHPPPVVSCPRTLTMWCAAMCWRQ